jgi:hypothetical protein
MQITEPLDSVQPAREPEKPTVKTFRRYFSLNNTILLGIIAVGAVLRWGNLLVLPIFADEKLHVQGGLAAQSGKLTTDSMLNLIRISRVVQSWFLAVIYFIFDNSNLLLLGRAFSGICGIVCILTCYKIGELLYSKRAGLIGAALWSIVPFAVWHERMNLADPMQNCYSALVIYFSLLLLRLPEGRKANIYAVLLGLSMAAAFLAKFNAVFSLPVPVLAALFLYPPARWKSFILRLFLAYYVAAMLVLPVLFFGRNDLGTYQRERQVALPTPDLLFKNLGGIVDWFYAYLTLPLFVLVGISVGWAIYKRSNPGKFLIGVALVPLLGQALFLVTNYPRYFLFILLPLLVLAGGFIEYLLGKVKGLKFAKAWVPAAALILVLPAAWFDLQIVTDPVEAALPKFDRIQYIEGAWSGTGVAQVKSFLLDEQIRAAKPVVVFTSPTIPSNSLEVELFGNSNFNIVQVDLIPGVDYVRLDKAFEGNPAYFVAMTPDETNFVKEYQQVYPNLNFVPVLTVPKPGNLVSWQVYRLDRAA